MKRMTVVFAAVQIAAAAVASVRTLSIEEYRDRMMGAWYGQSIGVSYGCPTEFAYKGEPIPDGKMPVWKPGMINETFSQDDLYVEMTFLATLDRCGIDLSPREAGIDFANSRYRLWCANHRGRNNLRSDIAPPDSSHPSFHSSPDDIDYQIEADFSGIVSPGLPRRVVALGETFGRIMNYGDGMYGGIFVGALYAEAYFTRDRRAIAHAALKSIPRESGYAEMVRDVLAWHAEHPADWKATHAKIVAKYYRGAKTGVVSFPEIDVKLNGAMVLLGLLHGDGDMDKTMRVATAGGFDSDCNPSSSCGVLGTILGAKGIDARYLEGLDRTKKWEWTDYDHSALFAVSERLMRKIVAAEGGRIWKDADGREFVSVPRREPEPPAFFDSRRPGPAAGSRFTNAEKSRILYRPCAKEGIPSEDKGAGDGE